MRRALDRLLLNLFAYYICGPLLLYLWIRAFSYLPVVMPLMYPYVFFCEIQCCILGPLKEQKHLLHDQLCN